MDLNPGLSQGDFPIIIIGAGISGLLLAQELRRTGVPFRIFERDNDLYSRGAGWGLTLHWSLPALRELLPNDLINQLRDAYVDRAGVERGESSTFPFYDLSKGEFMGAGPKLPERLRIRVTREKLRRLLATNIDIEVCDARVPLKPIIDLVAVEQSIHELSRRLRLCPCHLRGRIYMSRQAHCGLRW
jgi:2-polyprenyl-6-methoxyphenol hydroxylase-like FAD-dependent oxidoreductase